MTSTTSPASTFDLRTVVLAVLEVSNPTITDPEVLRTYAVECDRAADAAERLGKPYMSLREKAAILRTRAAFTFQTF